MDAAERSPDEERHRSPSLERAERSRPIVEHGRSVAVAPELPFEDLAIPKMRPRSYSALAPGARPPGRAALVVLIEEAHLRGVSAQVRRRRRAIGSSVG